MILIVHVLAHHVGINTRSKIWRPITRTTISIPNVTTTTMNVRIATIHMTAKNANTVNIMVRVVNEYMVVGKISQYFNDIQQAKALSAFNSIKELYKDNDNACTYAMTGLLTHLLRAMGAITRYAPT